LTAAPRCRPEVNPPVSIMAVAQGVADEVVGDEVVAVR